MNNIKRLAAMMITVAGSMAALADTSAPACAAAASCVETRSFVATVTGFRTSKQGSKRVLTATVRFENKSGGPLTLGYVTDSGVALDELGNRYLVAATGGVRAIGEIAGANVDPKFTLQPGEAGDARFELGWEPGKRKPGSHYELDLAIREITASSADPLKLGAEHALHFAALGESAPAVASAAAAAAAPAAPADPCGGSPRCYNAGAFVAEVMQVQSTAMTPGARHQSVTINIRFRNISDQPLILAYRSASSAAIDNFGNAFTWGRPGTHDTSVKGIGMVTGRSADTQFALSPGQSRNATFGVIRFNAQPPIGDHWNYDVVVEEIEIQPGQLVKSVRQNSLNFANLASGTFSAATTTPGAAALDGEVPADANAVASKIIDLFDRKTKKK